MLNKIYKYKIQIILVTMTVISGCNKLDIDNPNGGKNPSLTTAYYAAGYVYTGEYARLSSMFTQQLKGEDIHYEPVYEKYILPDNKLTESYKQAYRNGIAVAVDKTKEYQQIAESFIGVDENLRLKNIKKADEGRIITAGIYSIMIEYFYNAEKYNGRGEKQSALSYADILDVLNQITSSDYLDVANAIKARVYLNQKLYNEALNAVNLIQNFEDLEYTIEFAGSSTNMNEWQRFTLDRGGYLNADSVNIVNKYMLNDPRLPLYYTTRTEFNFPMSRNGLVPLIDNLELCFIRAELKLRQGDFAGSEESYREGIIKSMIKTGVTDYSNYLDLNGELLSVEDLALEQIITQKYLAMFGHPLVFVDYKRTLFPPIEYKSSNFPDKWTYFYQ